MPYTAINSMLDAGYPYGSLNYWKSSFMDELTDEAIEVFIDRFGQTKGPMTAFLPSTFTVRRRGCLIQPRPSARTIGFNVLIPSVWLDAAEVRTRTSAGHRRAARAPAAPGWRGT